MTNWKRWISLVLAAVMCLSCTGCFDIDSYLPSTQESTGSGLSTYQITVRTHSGRYLEGIGVRVFADPGKTETFFRRVKEKRPLKKKHFSRGKVKTQYFVPTS